MSLCEYEAIKANNTFVKRIYHVKYGESKIHFVLSRSPKSNIELTLSFLDKGGAI